MSFFLNSRNL